jgi:hypothetical protein
MNASDIPAAQPRLEQSIEGEHLRPYLEHLQSLAAVPGSEIEEDPYKSEDYQRFMTEVAKTCDADDSPCDSCLAGAPCDGPSRLDPLWDSGLDDDDLWDSQNR